jgi:hypothetical protein
LPCLLLISSSDGQLIGNFSNQAHNLILIYNSGTGKGNPAISFGSCFIHQGNRARYYNALDFGQSQLEIENGILSLFNYLGYHSLPKAGVTLRINLINQWYVQGRYKTRKV